MSESDTRPMRRIQRVRHELQRRDLEVVRVNRLSPNFVAVTLAGESLATFRSDSFDDHVKLFFGDDAKRDYTPRHHDSTRCELTLEFALHGTGAASDWARQARPGQRLLVGGPRGSMVIPMDYDWHLLIGDDSALPAVRRRLEELPADARVQVVLHAAAEDRQLPARPTTTQVRWVDTPEAMQAAVAALEMPAGEGFAWAAGEAATMAMVRTTLVDKGLTKEQLKVAAYWKNGAAAFHETLDA